MKLLLFSNTPRKIRLHSVGAVIANLRNRRIWDLPSILRKRSVSNGVKDSKAGVERLAKLIMCEASEENRCTQLTDLAGSRRERPPDEGRNSKYHCRSAGDCRTCSVIPITYCRTAMRGLFCVFLATYAQFEVSVWLTKGQNMCTA
jgi:hypothetical protein